MLQGATRIERQMMERCANIARYFLEKLPNAQLVDIRPIKKLLGISTGQYNSNKAAVIKRFEHLLPMKLRAKQKHNLLDAFAVCVGSLAHEGVIRINEIDKIGKFSKVHVITSNSS